MSPEEIKRPSGDVFNANTLLIKSELSIMAKKTDELTSNCLVYVLMFVK